MNQVRNPLYVPRGKAKEYGDYAVNIYTGCPHNCPYCYAPKVLHMNVERFHSHVEPRAGIVEGLEKQLIKMREEGIAGKLVHLCFTCDPYPQGRDTSVTREAIQLLKRYGHHVQILTKGDGMRDVDLLDMEDWYGITLDGSAAQWNEQGGRDGERHGGLSGEALFEQLARIHRTTNTWISFEPVLDAEWVLSLIRSCVRYRCGAARDRDSYIADKVKIGKLNYQHSNIDWAQFGRRAVLLCDEIGLPYYIKESLKEEMKGSMSRTEFTQFIYNAWDVGDNTTLGPQLLEGAVEYAAKLNEADRRAFFEAVLPSVPGIITECIRY